MATYLKRTSKLFDVSSSQPSAEMNLRDVICPVCRGILIEPVTLPCTHNLCLRCLKGTFEHNSLTCPLCRIRVGSWLRGATKSETLINSELWDLIKSRFSREIEEKHSDHDNELAPNSVYPPKIISAASKIRKEYGMQLQIAEEERRTQRKFEITSHDAAIRKLEEETRQKLAQYAQDQLFTKTIGKKQLLTKEANLNFYNNCTNIKKPSNEIEILPLGSGTSIVNNHPISHTKSERTNAWNTKSNGTPDKASQKAKNLVFDVKLATNRTEFCSGAISVHSVVTLKNQSVMLIQKSNTYYSEPSCSSSKIYGARGEEELHVPNDATPSSKSLGIEFCIKTIKNEERRIGSAESAGSHDSINQEIHHFKPIRAMPRTPLRFSQDGRQIDPKLIRVVPIFERVSNVPFKPPSPSKRIIGCSWSAFRGKIQPNFHDDCATNWKASSSLTQCHQSVKPTKPEKARRIDLTQDILIDNNKNYAKEVNRILNGTKRITKLIVDDETDNTADKGWRKCKNSNEKKKFSADENSSASWNQALLKISLSNENGAAIENIAERIKKRKVAQSQVINPIINELQNPRKTRSRTVSSDKEKGNLSIKSKRKIPSKSNSFRVKFTNTMDTIESPLVVKIGAGNVRVKRNSLRSKRQRTMNVTTKKTESITNKSLEDIAIEEQKKMERLLRQEKEDYELAQQLQAQFNEAGRISYRTRGSKRAVDSGETKRGIDKITISGRLLVNNLNTANTSRRATKSRRRQKRD